MPATTPSMALRRERLAALIDPASGVGLEIGPLDSPIATRPPWDVRYVDVLDTGGLRDHYRHDPNVSLERIVQVDFALQQDGQIRTIAEAAAPGGPYRWVVASHVVEHVPDLVGWLADVASLLEDGGALFLVVPDRRYTFDAMRPATTVGQILEARTRRDTRPSERAVYDYFRSAVDMSATALWEGADPAAAPRAFTFQGALSMRDKALQGEYVDSHVWVFSPIEFVSQLAELSELDLCDFALEHVHPTPPGELEFTVVLRRLPREANTERRMALRRSAVAAQEADGSLARLVAPPVPSGTRARMMEVSELEAALIGRKRDVMRHLCGLRERMNRRGAN